MAHKHHPKEARIRAVQQHDGGRPASEICKEMNISPATLKRWRDQLHLLAPPDAAKMREQEKTIEHMARVVAEQAVQIRILQMALEKTLSPGEVRQLAGEVAEQLTPASVRTLVAAASGPEGRVARRLPRASERLVCRTLDVNRNALRYRPRPGASASEIRRRVIALSLSLPTQGHRKIVSHMRKLGYQVGLRKVRGIRRSAGVQLAPPKPGVRRRGRTTSLHQGEATRPDQVWSWDFVMLRTRKGRALRVLFIIDEFTKRIVARFMATAIRQEDVVRVLLEAMIREEARPENIRSDNGSEFIAETVQGFMADQGIKAITIDPGCPWQNGVIESFNSRFRKEFSDRWYFHNYDDIQVAMDDWLLDYNRYRPHGSLGLMTPDEFAGKPVDRRAHLLTLVAG